MTIHQSKEISSTVSNTGAECHLVCTDKPSTNALGETPLPYAPLATLANGHQAVPQQYLQVRRSLENLEHILNRIEFDDHYILFAGQSAKESAEESAKESAGELYLQVGIIGAENYPQNEEQKHLKKIVYGRRWLIEPSTPTSEVIQTAMLAIKKVREHELREKITLHIDETEHKKLVRTTPFNNHMDLPLMSGNQSLLSAPSKSISEHEFAEQLEKILPLINVGSLSFKLEKIVNLDEQQTVISLFSQNSDSTKEQSDTLFPELLQARVTLVCNKRSISEFLHELMTKLVGMSDGYVEEHFNYQGFARFNRQLCPIKIAEFSYETRNIQSDDNRFKHSFKDMSYAVDFDKTPTFSGGELGKKQRALIEKCNVRGGHFPKSSQPSS